MASRTRARPRLLAAVGALALLLGVPAAAAPQCAAPAADGTCRAGKPARSLAEQEVAALEAYAEL